MSHTSPYEVATPKGLEYIKAPIYNIIAGRGECTFDNILLEYINTYADKFKIFIFEDWNFINTSYYNDINEKEEKWYKNLLNVKIKECQVKHRKNGHPYFTNNYGYLLLGLALVKHIVEAHQGTIEVQSEAGKGSTFTIKIPLEWTSEK